MQVSHDSKEWKRIRRQRRLVQAVLVGLAVAAIMTLIQWAILSTSRLEELLTLVKFRAVDFLYETEGDPGDDIVIVSIDQSSQEALGEFPWTADRYLALFGRLTEAKVVGLNVLLTDLDLNDHPGTPGLLKAIRKAGNVIIPLTAADLAPPRPPARLYLAGQPIVPSFALLDAAAGAGIVQTVPDADGVLRRVPLLVGVGGGQETWEAFGLRVLRQYLDLVDGQPTLGDGQVVIAGASGSGRGREIPTDAGGAMLVDFVGLPGTFPRYSFVDVIEGRVSASAFAGKIVLVGVTDTHSTADTYRTPVSQRPMTAVEFHANAIHTLLYRRFLAWESEAETTLVVVVLALASALVLSQLGIVSGLLFTVVLSLAYWIFGSLRFDVGRLPNVLFPLATILAAYAGVTVIHLIGVQRERRRVSDVFGRFVSAEVRDVLVDLALQDPNLIRPGGRQTEMTILFVDIRGFASISERLPPSEVIEVLNLYLDRLEEQVFKYGGTLDKYTGDGMMVLFGAPLTQPDHAERAVRTALSMQQAIAEVSRERGDAQVEVACGIGIATGMSVVGQVGSRRRLDYTAIGDTVNLASRLEAVAPPGTILINQGTYEAVKGVVHVKALEPVKVKGREGPVVVYSVLGLQEG